MLPGIRWKSLQAKIIAWSFVPTAIILLAVAMVAFRAYQQMTERWVVERDRAVIHISAGRFKLRLEDYASTLSALARIPAVYQNDPVAQRSALGQASRRLVIFDAGVLLLDATGRVVAAEPERLDDVGQDWSGRVYYQTAVRSHIVGSNKFFVSDIVPDGPGGAEVVAFTVPVVGERGEFQGVLAGLFHLGATATNAFYADIIKLRLAESGSVYLVDSRGRAIYHSDADLIGANLSGQAVVQRVLHGQAGAVRTRTIVGRDSVAGFAPVPDTAWGLVAEEDWATLMSSSQGYQHLLLLLLVLGVLAPALVVAVGVRQITRPIAALISAAQQVARGNFGQTITAQTGDEIEELARQFNTMSRELRVFYEFMDQRVADRTREMEEAQARLELALLETERQRQMAESLRQVAQVLTASLDRDTVLAHIVEQLGCVIRYDGSGIFLHDGDSLFVSRGGRLSDAYMGRRVPLSGSQPFVRVFKTRHPLVISDVRDDPGWTVWEDGEHIRGWMGAPLMIGERAIGVLTADSFEVGAYDEQDVQVLQIFAHQAAIAIENARLYQQSRELAILEERNRLARELHDSITQSLYSLRLLSEGWRRQVSAGDVEHAAEYLGRIGEITQQALKEMRLLVHELRPPTLEQQGLLGALRYRLDAVEKRAGVEVRLVAEDVFEWPAPIEDGLYRIAQEALNNAIKHSAATCVTVRLRIEAGHAVLEVIDNGRGFDVQTAGQGGGMGLASMRERVEHLQGALSILSEPGAGTTIQASVPLAPV